MSFKNLRTFDHFEMSEGDEMNLGKEKDGQTMIKDDITLIKSEIAEIESDESKTESEKDKEHGEKLGELSDRIMDLARSYQKEGQMLVAKSKQSNDTENQF